MNYVKKIFSPEIVVIFIFPLVLLLINNSWIFTPATTFIDPWLNVGYFRNLPQHLQVFPDTYYGSRLSWILPGFLIYQLFPPLLANYILHLGVYYLATISLYFTNRLIFNKRVALLTTLLMSGYIWFLRITGFDQVNGIGIAYFLLTILLLTCAAKLSRWKNWLFLAGIGYAALIYTNLFLIIFTPFLGMYYLFANYQYQKHRLLPSLVFFLVGILALTLLFSVINQQITGKFLFFLPSIKISMELLSKPNPWRMNGYAWILDAGWLVWPIAVGLTSLLHLMSYVLKRSAHRNRFALFFHLQFVLILLLFLAIDMTGYSVALQYFYYTNYLIPSMFLAIASALVYPVEKLSKHKLLHTLIPIAILLLLISYLISLVSNNVIVNIISYPTVLALIIFLVAWIVLFAFSSQIITIFIFFLLLSISNALGIWHINKSDIDYWPNERQDAYLLTIDSMQIINTINPHADSYFWHDRKPSPVSGLYTAIASTYLWGYRLLSTDFPLLTGENSLQEVKPDMNIIILSQETINLHTVNETLEKYNLKAQFIDEKIMTQGAYRVILTFIKTLQR